jgi:hypothetical protein
MHDVAFVDDQVRVTGWPTNALLDAGDSVTVGGPLGGVEGGIGELLPPQAVSRAQLTHSRKAPRRFDKMASRRWREVRLYYIEPAC